MNLKYLIDDILIYEDDKNNYYYTNFIKSFVLGTSILKADIMGNVDKLSKKTQEYIKILNDTTYKNYLTVGGRTYENKLKIIYYCPNRNVYFFKGANIENAPENFILEPYEGED